MIAKPLVFILVIVSYCEAQRERNLQRGRQTVDEAIDGGAGTMSPPPRGIRNLMGSRRMPDGMGNFGSDGFSNLMDSGMEMPNINADDVDSEENEQRSGGFISNLRGNKELPGMAGPVGLRRRLTIEEAQAGGAGTLDLGGADNLRRRGPGSGKRVLAGASDLMASRPNELPDMGVVGPTFWENRLAAIEKSMNRRRWGKNNWGGAGHARPEALPRNDGSITRGRFNREQLPGKMSKQVTNLLTTTAGGPYETIQNIMNNLNDPSTLNVLLLEEICKSFENMYCKTKDCFA